MVKKELNTGKKQNESLDLETSVDSPVSKDEQYPSPHKTHISSKGNVESFDDKAEGKAGSSPERKLQAHVSFSHKQIDQSDIRTARPLSQTLLPTSRRKTRQELQKEKTAATTIQAAWRGSQIRKEIIKMTKAATKIQATFRGHKIRKELPLCLCEFGRSKSKKKKKHARKENRSILEFQSCFKQLSFMSTTPQSQSILSYNTNPRNYLTVIGEYPQLSPEITFLETEAGHKSHAEMFTCSSLSVLATEFEWQRYHKAAVIIQAAWRGYQVRKMAGIIVQTEKSHSKSFSFNYVCKETLRKGTILNQSSESGARTGNTILLGFVPRIRNINICTVVKGTPASQKPNIISIQVSSPNSVIQGFQRERSTGLQGLYTIRSPGALNPSHLFVHVDMRKELKTLSSLITEDIPSPQKKPKSRKLPSKGAAEKNPSPQKDPKPKNPAN